MRPVAIYPNSSFLPVCSFSMLFGTLFFLALALLLSGCNNEKYSQKPVLSSYLCYAMNLYSLSRSDGLLKLHWNEQINVNFRQVIYFSSECYTVLHCTLTRAGQNEKIMSIMTAPIFQGFWFFRRFFSSVFLVVLLGGFWKGNSIGLHLCSKANDLRRKKSKKFHNNLWEFILYCISRINNF